MLSGGIKIPDGADLNNYTTPGNYYCPKDVSIPTLKNCPLNHAFILKVRLSTGEAYPSQEIIEFNTGKKAYRVLYLDNVWQDWIFYVTNTDLNPEVYIVPKPSDTSTFTFGNRSFQVSVRKSGKVVTIQLNISGSMAAISDFVTAFTIPQKYKPLTDIVINYVTQNTAKAITLLITQNGEVKFTNFNTSIDDWLCRQCITYVTDN